MTRFVPSGILFLAGILVISACRYQPQADELPFNVNPPEPPNLAEVQMTSADLPLGMGELRLGLSPSSASRTADDFVPMTDYLATLLDVPIRTIDVASYSELIDLAVAGEVELALLPPLSYVLANERSPQVRVIAQQMSFGATTYSSYVLIKADDPSGELADLKGRRVAFVDQYSTSGFLFPYAAFLAHGIDPERDFDYTFAGGHAQVVRLLASNDADAAATASGSAREHAKGNGSADETQADVRILYKAGRIPYDALCSTGGLNERAIKKVQGAMLHINTRDRRGRLALRSTHSITGWIPADDQRYEPVRKVQAVVREHLEKAKHATEAD